MRKLGTFTFVSLDGYFAGPHGEIDGFKQVDEEDRRFSAENADPSATLVFGRTTYELMRSFWPTPAARQADPVTAKTLNTAKKIVISRTLGPQPDGPVWKNVTVIHEMTPEVIRNLKTQPGGDMVILGSGSLVRQLANLGLIDEFGLLVTPVILGKGKYLFEGVKKTNLQLLESRALGSGKVFLRYRPAERE